jgi:hypothetical protein
MAVAMLLYGCELWTLMKQREMRTKKADVKFLTVSCIATL